MSKAKDYIEAYTKRCSNESDFRYKSSTQEVRFFQPWLTPENALAAVEIERQEVIEKAAEFLRNNLCNYFDNTRDEFDRFIDDFYKVIRK